ncbi:MAG: hypothetical protein K1X38_05830 [Microthrixaceae bacterium]|nr:hypothetical protein [Microthrixaceae bacterium]
MAENPLTELQVEVLQVFFSLPSPKASCLPVEPVWSPSAFRSGEPRTLISSRLACPSSCQLTITTFGPTCPAVELAGVPFTYDWRTKAEPVLWITDAIGGSCREHLVGQDSARLDRLVANGVIDGLIYP